MNVQVRASHADLPAGVELRVRLALGRIAHRLEQVTVQVVDVDNTDGGTDAFCRVQVQGVDGWTVTTMDADNEPLWALGSALRRAMEAIEIELRQPAPPANGTELAS